jgi:uncharacterized protein YbjT (DUF2867 family)
VRFRPGRSAAIVNIGAALVADLVGAGHSVTALVRTEAAAAKATGLGARARSATCSTPGG